MGIAPIPSQPDIAYFKQQLYDEYRIEVPCLTWQGQQLIRISVQGYNCAADLAALTQAVQTLIR
jgi:isopenicillin-N epimerase